MNTVLEVKNLKVYYYTSKGVVRAVDDITFNLQEGETLGIVGESGCGKTTMGVALLNMPTPPGKIAGGQIIIDDQDIVPLSEKDMRRLIRWQKIAMVFQGAMNCLTPVFNVGKIMMETLQEHIPMKKEEAMDIIKKYLEYVGLPPEVIKKYPHELSGGMKQRVVIAMALFLKPKVVIFDEPTTALDVIVQCQILNLIKKLKKERSLVSCIFITHDLATEAEVSDKIMVMYAGKIAEIGKNEHIYSYGGAHPYTKKLIAATPRIHQKVDRLSFIPDAPPDLIDPPLGCRFNPRCDVVMDKCKTEEPPLIEIEGNHRVACWRVGYKE